MLPSSRKPEVIRLHSLQDSQRQRFIGNYLSTLMQIFPSAFKYKLFSHPLFKNLLPDIYFTYMTICQCQRRLGEQYTYVAMCKNQHYQNEGVLVNKKYRTLVFVLQIIGRNIVPYFMQTIQNKINNTAKQPLIKALIKCIGSTSDILSNVQWFLMMLFMLDLSKSPNLIDNKLGLGYIYTFFNETQTQISYKWEGLLLLSVFIIKLVTFFFNLRKQIIFQQNKKHIQITKTNNHSQQNHQINAQQQPHKQSSTNLCRICYDLIKQKSCTKCGHIFCWQCIIKSLEFNSQCPVCRTKCLPRQVIQLINF